jgi:hypothetical protein
MGINQTQSFWRNLREKIEVAYQRNGEKKARLLGYSLGALVVHHFLTEETTAEWRSKYIEKVCLLAPPLSGAAIVPVVEYLGHFEGSFWKAVTPKRFGRTIRTWPAIHTFLPNSVLFKSYPILMTENKVVTGAQLIDFLLESAGFDENQKAILQATSGFSRALPAALDVKTFVVYNGGVGTMLGMDLRRGVPFVTRGDGLVHAAGAEWACTRWPNVTCFDIDNEEIMHAHMGESHRRMAGRRAGT